MIFLKLENIHLLFLTASSFVFDVNLDSMQELGSSGSVFFLTVQVRLKYAHWDIRVTELVIALVEI